MKKLHLCSACGALLLALLGLNSCTTTHGTFNRMDYVVVRINGRLFDCQTHQFVPVMVNANAPNAIADICSVLHKAELAGTPPTPEQIAANAAVPVDKTVWLHVECVDKDGFISHAELRGADMVTIGRSPLHLPAEIRLDHEIGRILQRYGFLDRSLKLEWDGKEKKEP